MYDAGKPCQYNVHEKRSIKAHKILKLLIIHEKTAEISSVNNKKPKNYSKT